MWFQLNDRWFLNFNQTVKFSLVFIYIVLVRTSLSETRESGLLLRVMPLNVSFVIFPFSLTFILCYHFFGTYNQAVPITVLRGDGLDWRSSWNHIWGFGPVWGFRLAFLFCTFVLGKSLLQPDRIHEDRLLVVWNSN